MLEAIPFIAPVAIFGASLVRGEAIRRQNGDRAWAFADARAKQRVAGVAFASSIFVSAGAGMHALLGGARGYDAGKKINGRKRHIVTDTQGFLVGAIVHTADIQDRDGAPDVLASIRHSFPWLRHVFADGGYAGDKLRKALTKIGKWTLEIIKRSDRAKGF